MFFPLSEQGLVNLSFPVKRTTSPVILRYTHNPEAYIFTIHLK